MKQKDRKQRREIDEDFDIGKFFDLATTNKLYVNNLNLLDKKMKLY